jgi:hypothetical protein
MPAVVPVALIGLKQLALPQFKALLFLVVVSWAQLAQQTPVVVVAQLPALASAALPVAQV